MIYWKHWTSNTHDLTLYNETIMLVFYPAGTMMSKQHYKKNLKTQTELMSVDYFDAKTKSNWRRIGLKNYIIHDVKVVYINFRNTKLSVNLELKHILYYMRFVSIVFCQICQIVKGASKRLAFFTCFLAPSLMSISL